MQVLTDGPIEYNLNAAALLTWLCCFVAAQACNAAASERQQLRQLEGQVARLAGVLRQVLISVSSSGSMAILEPPKSGTPPIMVGAGAGNCLLAPVDVFTSSSKST
jgi:hypothetical protein